MGKLNDITFTKGNGGLGREAASEDPITGLIMYIPEVGAGDLANVSNTLQFDTIDSDDGENTLYVTRLKYVEELVDYGITKQPLDTEAQNNIATVDAFKKRAALNTIHYHVSEFFRKNNEGTLYLMIRIAGSNIAATDIKQLQYYAGGTIRQCGVFTPGLTNLAGYQTSCTELENEHQPLSVVVGYAGKTIAYAQAGTEGSYTYTGTVTDVVELTDLASTSTNSVLAGRRNISLMVGCDLDGEVLESLAQYGYYSAIGLIIGVISKALVYECIAYVAKFPLSLSQPGLISGEIIKDISVLNQERINDNRYIFIRIHVGDADNYFNDSHTLDVATSDYAYIENNRTMDKAVRGVRTNLLPYLNSPLKVDAATGNLDKPTVSFLETVAQKALTNMEKAGELSGYQVEIDANQNVLATSQVEIIIKQVPIGVMRKVHVKIGFKASLT